MMDLESPFFKAISHIADVVAIVTIFTFIPYGLVKRNKNLVAFHIGQFIHYLFRSALIILILTILFFLTDFFYLLFLLALKKQVNVNVNYYWENGKEFQHILAYFTVYSFGLSVAWMICSIVWTSSLNSAKDFVNLFLPKNKIFLKQEFVLEITNATYGSAQKQVDVTQVVRQMVANNRLTVTASNELGGDPHFGVAKQLIINYRIGQLTKEVRIDENSTLTIP